MRFTLTLALFALTGTTTTSAGPVPPDVRPSPPNPVGKVCWPVGLYAALDPKHVGPGPLDFALTGWVWLYEDTFWWDGPTPLTYGFKRADRVVGVAGFFPRTVHEWEDIPRYLRPGSVVTVWVLRGWRVVGVPVAVVPCC